ncbi:undecaprenyl diphosphate synthase family protein [Streptomyces sp. NPDC101150]|uniref:undecaprenyl diphosphate synthase family protein n=1 Tax=Streptomyces sp. NPDC101150 TaxID=3366114 RepID=UPI0038187F99
MAPADGHPGRGLRPVRRVEWSDEAGVLYLTWWVLSRDNLKRPPEEVGVLFVLIDHVVRELC